MSTTSSHLDFEMRSSDFQPAKILNVAFVQENAAEKERILTRQIGAVAFILLFTLLGPIGRDQFDGYGLTPVNSLNRSSLIGKSKRRMSGME